ncbi:MAG: hypothetical protein IIA61_09190 [Candidatus Marinimicrobia bacterium]|nr:hypothetical protein [Candidatus Neomarinimicrobiota bacterium]
MKYMSLELSTRSIECTVMSKRGDLIHCSSFILSLEKVRDVIDKVKLPIALVFEECELAGWLYCNLVYDVDQIVVAEP